MHKKEEECYIDFYIIFFLLYPISPFFLKKKNYKIMALHYDIICQIIL
jgi:hypothetical protein